jgi:3'(2'), 5'-bisphosphate nucleotidase
MYAGSRALGAWMEADGKRHAIVTREVPAEGLTVAASRSHGDNKALDAFLAGRLVATQRIAGSSLKFCLIAAAEADLYARFGRTMEWDTAAGHAVLAAAGGSVTDVSGRELGYGKPGLENPYFIAWGRGPERG